MFSDLRRLFAGLVIVATAALAVADAQAQEKRFALVIGNADYPSQPGKLNNPRADADRIADALEAVGFNVTRRFDLSQSEMVDAVGALSHALSQAGPEAVGFFYYSGHGASAEINGRRRNYVMPARTTITNGQQLQLRGVPLDQLLDGLAAANAKAVFFVSDACRNTLPWTDAKGGEQSKAFAPVAQRSGLYVAFAAADGQTTPDDGVFAAYLAQFIRQPGHTADRAFTLAMREVAKHRSGERLPFTADGLNSDICFAGCRTTPPPPLVRRPQDQAESCPFGDSPQGTSWCDGGNARRFEPGQGLFVGTRDNCNAGIVTTDATFLGCPTRLIGYAIRDNRASADSNKVDIYVGATANKNAGYVTNSQLHKGGATRAIGVLSRAPFQRGVRLYVGTQANCNAGEVTTTPGHKGCSTRDIGYALPSTPTK